MSPARMALEAMRSAPEPPSAAALDILERVLRDFDVARARLTAPLYARRLTTGHSRDQPP